MPSPSRRCSSWSALRGTSTESCSPAPSSASSTRARRWPSVATISRAPPLSFSRAPLSWKRDSSAETAKRILETMRRKSPKGMSMRCFSLSWVSVGRLGKSSGERPWILKRELPARIDSTRGSSCTRWTSSPTSERMISINFLAWTAMPPSAATSASHHEVSETSRSVAARCRRSLRVVSSRCERTGMVVLRSTIPCMGINSARNSLRLSRISIYSLRARGQEYNTATVDSRR